MNIEAGQVIDGKYRVLKLLGQGGMGAVYLAEHTVIGRRVAVKVLLGNVAGNETAVARFEREAQAAGRIGNDHILEILDFGSLPDGARYMVCEYLDGETLASRLTREQRMTPASLVPIARQLLSGLGAAHQAGVVHRDLKPENIFILRQKAGLSDFVKIIDFGISKFQPMSSGEGMQMTATGIVVGTPCYLSPEQARGSREADARSDLYAVGVILYECVTGLLPFDAQNVNDLLFKIVLESPRPLRDAAPDVDPGFAQLIEIAMARDPEHRFQSSTAFIAALDTWAMHNGLPLSGRPGNVTPPPGGVPAQSGAARLASGSSRSLAPTPRTWADSQVSMSAFQTPARRKGRVVAIGLAASVLVAGGAFALLKGGDANGGNATSGAPSTSISAAPSPVPSPEVAPTATVAPIDTSLAPGPDLAIPPVSPSDVKALLDPPVGGTHTPRVGNKRPPTQTPATKKTADAEPVAPPPPPPVAPPPTTDSKRHRDFGY
ncbi:MAG TPA: protein kinase [Polyangiaceae bacterium]|nr:protein kinase [Polyangiaceae bacterium]